MALAAAGVRPRARAAGGQGPCAGRLHQNAHVTEIFNFHLKVILKWPGYQIYAGILDCLCRCHKPPRTNLRDAMNATKMKAIASLTPLPIDHEDALLDWRCPCPSRPRDLLVRVAAVSVNPVDTKVR